MAEERKNIVKGQIGNALESVAPDHILGVSKDIFDEQRQQYQETINEAVGDYVENPEFVWVLIDKDDKILIGINASGEVIFGDGCPPQVKDYVAAEIAKINANIDEIVNGGEEGKVDNLTKIVEFLKDYSTSDSLKSLLDTKVDKEEGKGIIPLQYAQEIEDNPEYVKVTTDSEDKILEGIKVDGTKVVGGNAQVGGDIYIEGDAKVVGNVEIAGVSYTMVENPEYIKVIVDSDNKIIMGIKTDGTVYIPILQNDSIDTQLREALEKMEQELEEFEGTIDEKVGKFADFFDSVDSPEFLAVTVDSEDKILEGLKKDGTKVIGADLNVGGNSVLNGDLQVLGSLDISGATYSLCQSPEWIKVLVDSQERIIAGVRTDGSVYIGELEIPASLQSVINTLTAENVSLDERLQALESIISVTENPEFIQVTTDSEDKILEGITTDGVKKVNIPVDNGAAIIESVDNPEYIEAKVDAEGRLIEGINKNGEKIFGVIPPQIKQYIDDNMPTGGSGVQSIEYEDATGDMYATYDDESGVTDVYMEPNGDIYVESEE